MLGRSLAPLTICLALTGTAATAETSGIPKVLSLDGIGGATPGATVAAAERRWGVDLRVQTLPGTTCGTASLRKSGVDGYVLFLDGKLGSVWFRKGASTGRGIRIGSTLAQLRQAYPRGLRSQPNEYTRGARDYYLRRARKPHWELRFDVSPTGRVDQLAFGDATVHYSEGCA